MSKPRVAHALSGAFLGLSLLAGTVTPLAAQSAAPPAQAEDSETAELVGYTVFGEPMTNADWIDPVIQFELDPNNLAPLPDFDVETFHDSTVFATGVDRVSVTGDNTANGVELDKIIERHRRVLQAIDTLDQYVAANGKEINAKVSRVGRLLEAIDHEHRQEARLADEIAAHKTAIAEFAVQAFIGQDQDDLGSALSAPSTNFSKSRVVTDEVREDQVAQINDRENELARRQRRRSSLERDVSQLRSELRVLRRERAQILEHRRVAYHLPIRIEASYKLALHERLPDMVAGTDIPLVALNAYVIAERTLAVEEPTCRIEWWMLAGIGKIESFHGHFGNSTLNVNGHTTEHIRGPALDGRILEGAEFVTDGNAPAATGRTEEHAAPVAAKPAAPVEPAAASPTAGDAPEALASADTANVNGADATAEPVPVVKRLALIVDSDGGRLDNDQTYDRAVGPMQFIPSTWRLYEADGNADDKSDPQNIYDAALASARYLCAATGTMATPEGRKVGYFAYNHDEEYSANVAATGDRYREAITISPDEYGDTNPLGIGDPEPFEQREKAKSQLESLRELVNLDW